MTATATFDPAADDPAAGVHPDLDRWIAYHAGETGDDEVTDLQDHLASCRDCTALVLDLEAFADPRAADRRAAVSDFAQATAWRALRPRLPSARGWYLPAALAASFLVAAAGLSGWLQQQRELDGLRREIADLSQPQANVPVYDLYLGSTLRDELRARILDAGGETLATVDGLELDELGVATLGLSHRTLASGDYVVRVEARRGGGWTAIGDYPLRLRFRRAGR
jgi:hypothetical protein